MGKLAIDIQYEEYDETTNVDKDTKLTLIIECPDAENIVTDYNRKTNRVNEALADIVWAFVDKIYNGNFPEIKKVYLK